MMKRNWLVNMKTRIVPKPKKLKKLFKRLQLPNELVAELCAVVPAHSSAQILCISAKLNVYLEQRFRTHLMTYTEGIAFIKERLQMLQEITIKIASAVFDKNKWQENTHASSSHMPSVLVAAGALNLVHHRKMRRCMIFVDKLNHPCLSYFMRLIAPLFRRPYSFRIHEETPKIDGVRDFVAAMGKNIRMFRACPSEFLKYRTAFNQCDYLKLHMSKADIEDVQFRQSLVEWLTSGTMSGPKKALAYVHYDRDTEQELRSSDMEQLVRDLKQEFASARAKDQQHPFALRFVQRSNQPFQKNFVLSNSRTGEQLQLQGDPNVYCRKNSYYSDSYKQGRTYLLLRCPNAVAKKGNQCDKFWEFNAEEEASKMVSVVVAWPRRKHYFGCVIA